MRDNGNNNNNNNVDDNINNDNNNNNNADDNNNPEMYIVGVGKNSQGGAGNVEKRFRLNIKK